MDLTGRSLTQQEWQTTIAAPGWERVYRANFAMRILMGVLSGFLMLFFVMIWAAIALMVWKVSRQIALGVYEKEFQGQVGGLLAGIVFLWFSVRDTKAQFGDWFKGPIYYTGVIDRNFDNWGQRVMLHFAASGPWVWGVWGKLKLELRVGRTFAARFHPRTNELLDVYVLYPGSGSRSPEKEPRLRHPN